jgi:hypothetical protein
MDGVLIQINGTGLVGVLSHHEPDESIAVGLIFCYNGVVHAFAGAVSEPAAFHKALNSLQHRAFLSTVTMPC